MPGNQKTQKHSTSNNANVKSLQSKIKVLSYITYISLAIGIIAIGIAGIALLTLNNLPPPTNTVTTANTTTHTQTLAGINTPLNSSELSVINNAPNSYFETAGEMLLNGSIADSVGAKTNSTAPYTINGKPSVIYLGSITCIFCGENRWAMALALSRFGEFSSLYKGYSSLGDGDLPTLYWRVDNTTAPKAELGNYYTSNYINFISIEDTDPITGGFNLQSLSAIHSEINSTGNSTYLGAINKIIANNNFQGTPYTIWGNFIVPGADAEIFGNTPPNSTGILPLQSMTHAQVLRNFAVPNSQFAWGEYAAADLYVAMTCNSINNAASVCSLPAIQELEKLGY